MPIGAFAEVSDAAVAMRCIVVSPDGSRAARAEASGRSDRPADVGVEAAERLLAAGAGEILDALR